MSCPHAAFCLFAFRFCKWKEEASFHQPSLQWLRHCPDFGWYFPHLKLFPSVFGCLIISKWPSHKSGHEREKQKDAEWDNWKRSSGCSYCGLRSHVSSATVSSCSHPTPSPSSRFLKDSGSSSAYSTHSTLHLTCPNMISPVKINSATSKEHVE